jgi:tetratricopeptide (TPR) repeat protein
MSSDPRPDPSSHTKNVPVPVPETLQGHATSPTTGIADGGAPMAISAGVRPLPEYELISLLGRGGFGEVWKATGPGGFEVALKFIRLGEQAGRIELRSLELMKGIRHAHLLPMFGAWQKEGLLIIAMELADRTLWHRWQETIQQGLPGIPQEEMLVYLHEAAKGLDFLNDRRHQTPTGETLGIQHKDIKPQNLLLVGGTVKVADFGLAKVLEHTVTNASGGLTPAYAAPEFFQGQATRWSDQYCLAVSYCLLRGGRLPFEGSGVQIMAGHVMQAPDLSMLPEGERAAVDRALAKDPQSRWPTSREFAEAVAAGAGHGKIASHTTAPITQPAAIAARPSPQSRKRRVRLPALLAAIVVPSVAAIAIAWMGRSHSGTTDVPAADARRDDIAAIADQPKVDPPVAKVPPPTGATPTFREPPAPNPLPVGILRMASVASTHVETGKTGFLHVRVQRQDCTGPVQVQVEGLPHGLSAAPLMIAADQESGRIELRAADDATAGVTTVRVRAELDKLHVEQQTRVTVRLSPGVRLAFLDAVTLQRRRVRSLSVQLRRRNFSGPVEVRLENLPDGVSGPSITIPAGSDSGRLELNSTVRAALRTSTVRMVAVATGIRAESNFRLTVVSMRSPAEWFADYDEALRQHPDDSGTYCDRGRLHFDQKDYVKAVADLSEAIRLDPAYAAAYTYRSGARIGLKEIDKALADADRAVELDPSRAMAFNNRGVARADRNEYTRALDDYTEAIRLDPRYALAYANRAGIYVRLREPDKALTDYDTAIRLDPNYAASRIGRANLHRTKKQFDLALADYDVAIRLDPQSPVAFNNRGNTYLDKADYDRAIADYTEAIRLDPKYILGYSNRARAYDKKGDTERAKADRQKAAKLTSPTSK